MSFESLKLSKSLLIELERQNYKQAYPIQEKVIPAILQKKDVLGIAKTGSGKTASYVLPILDNVQANTVTKNRHISALVLVPSRELAIQVQEVFQSFASTMSPPLKTIAVFGGVSINPQMKDIQNTSILVATPGRLLDLVDSNAVHLSDIQTLVLDEADKMLNLGFKDEMNRIFKLLPQKRQNLLFSATLSPDLEKINQLIFNKPIVIKLDEDGDTLDLIKQVGYFVEDGRKGPLLRHLIKSNNMKQVLIFASSIKRVDNIANKLRNNGIEARAIHSKKTQGVRTDLLTKFKHGKLPVLVATDLISRGIDIEFLPYVINYELPRSPKDYIHRIGRTGRAENPGEAISFVSEDEKNHFTVIQKKMGKLVTMINIEDIDF